MKRLLIIIGVFVLFAGGFAACDKNEPKYEGPDYAMFADTLTVCPVVETGEATVVEFGVTRAAGHDRTFAVEIIDAGSNAVDGYHYILENPTVTIPAGERAGSVRVRGIYDHVADTDSLGFRLRLVAPEEMNWDLYGIETKVRLQKVCPFILENFTGYAVVRSAFFQLYKPKDQERIITTSVAEGKENTIVLHDFFYDGYDAELVFDNSDILDPRVKIQDCILGTTQEAFSAIYGDAQLRMTDYKVVPSLFSTCGNYASLFSTIYVKDFGTVGSFQTIIEWISDDEANGI